MAITAAKKKYPAKPKRPKGKMTVTKLETYKTKLQNWKAACREVDKENNKGKSLAKAVEGLLK